MAAPCCASDRFTNQYSQRLEIISGELLPGEPIPLLKHRRELSRKEAVQLWGERRKQGWRPCPPQW